MTTEEAGTLLLQSLGYDTSREGLRDTPKRMARMLRELCTPEPFNFTTFDSEGTSEMVVQAGIRFHSLCEHHVLQFVGLSKLARCVRYCAAGLQNQERITKAVADMINKNLEPAGVGVVLRAEHMCMTMRGVKSPGALTTTSCLTGCFLDDARCRAEFVSLSGGQR
jgi:GTP cyclohydrolase I